MNLLPVPRELDLGTDTAVLVEPRVHVGAPGLPAEGYALSISVDGITLDAADGAGAFYGRATLGQLARLHDGRVPVGTVRDWPDLAERGVMLDVSRDKVPTHGHAVRDRRPTRGVEGQPPRALRRAHLRLRRPRDRLARREPVHRDGDRRARRVLRGASHGARAQPELPRAHEPVAPARAVPGARDGPRGLHDDGHAAAAEHDRADRPRRARTRAEPARRAAPPLLRSALRARRAGRAVGAAATSGSTTTSRGSPRCGPCPRSTAASCSSGATSSPRIPTGSPSFPPASPSASGATTPGIPGRHASRPSPTPASPAGSRRGPRRGSPSSAGPPTCAPTSPRPSTRGSPTTPAGCSTPTGATTAISSTSRSAIRGSPTARPWDGARPRTETSISGPR